MTTILENKKKGGEQFSEPINFFFRENQKLKFLSKEHQKHISRHIPHASFSSFAESIERQRKHSERSRKEWAIHRAHRGKVPVPEEGEYFPCFTCLEIAKILGI